MNTTTTLHTLQLSDKEMAIVNLALDSLRNEISSRRIIGNTENGLYKIFRWLECEVINTQNNHFPIGGPHTDPVKYYNEEMRNGFAPKQVDGLNGQ